ncbi:gliding motility-associated C-terminal domain-containing protein [Chitinophagaceae bacterium MMS25-I14]
MLRKLYPLLIALSLFSFSAKAQLIINEISQGNSGNREFVEFVVNGTRTCTDSCLDLRGWIIDDNGGWYGSGSGQGIATGCVRFANLSNWSCVPYGSIILVYNSAEKNVTITLADDPTDANHDYVYVLPDTSSYLQRNTTTPTTATGTAFSYPSTGFGTAASGTWLGSLSLANGGDAFLTINPAAPSVAAHSIAYGTVTAGTPVIYVSAIGSQKNCYLSNGSYTSSASYTVGNVGTSSTVLNDETPGAANTTANATWITSLRTNPAPITNAVSASICQGQSYTLGSNTYTTAGSYTVHFTTAGGCDSAVTLTLTVNTLPAAPTVTSPVTYCQNSTAAQLTATGSNLLWYTGVTGGTGNNTAPTPVTTAAGSTTYYVSQTTSGCESPRASIVVNVTATPAAPAVITPLTYCQNSSATALTATGSNLLWYTGATGGTGNATSPTPVTTATSSTTYYVSQTVSGCESPRASIVVNVTAQPSAPTVTTPITYCQNSIAPSLSATGTNLLWYAGATGGTANSTAPTPVTTSAGSTTYYVSQTVSGCESPRTSIVVNITATPSAPAVTTPVTYCQNSAATALTATGSNLLWYAGATGGTGSGTAPTPVTTTAGSTTYYVSQTVSGCESPRAAIVVNITATPAAPTVATPLTYCQNSTATALTATGSNLLWYAGATGGTGNSTAPIPVTASAGSTTYYVSQTVSGCESPRASIVVNVTAQPAAPTVSSPLTYCQNSVAPSLTATGSNLKWYAGATGGTGNSTAPTPVTTASGSTTYYVSQTISGCESPRAAIVVNITATPVAPTVTTPVTYCQNSTATALTATGSNLLWYAGATGGTGSGTAPTPVTTSAGSTTYYVSQTVSGCESPRAAITVTVNATPAIPVVSSPVTYCEGSTATSLTATGTNLQWYTAPTGGTAATTAPVPVTTTAGSTIYYVSSLSAAGCESGRASITVNVNARPLPPATTNVTYCQNQSASPLTVTGSNLLWYTSATGGTGSATAPTPGTASVGTTNYYVSQTVNGCESNRALLSVTVAASATTPVVTSPVYLCQNSGTVTLGTYVVGSNLLWYTSSAGGTGSATTPSVNTATLGATTWYVSATAGSCETSRIPLVVNVVGKPAKPVVTNDSLSYCQNSPVQQFAVTGSNLLWYTTATGGTGSPAAPVLTSAANGIFTWYVTQTVNGCESNRASATIKVAAQPAPPVVTPVYTYCQFSTAAPLNVTGTNLHWYTVATGGTYTTATPTVNTQAWGVYTYYVSQTVNGCESQRSLITVNVTERPAPPVVVTPITYCMNAPAASLTAIGNSLLWYYSSVGGSGTNIPPVPSTLYVDTVSYWVTQSNNGCESPRSRLDVYVHYKPNGVILASKSSVCQYDTASFIYFGNAYPSSQYDWKSPINATTVLSGANTQGPVVIRFDSAGTQKIRMQVNDNGCVSDPAFLDVKVKPAPVVSTVVPKSVCAGETVQIALDYTTAGVDAFLWNFDGGQVVYGSNAGPYGIIWTTPGEHHVQLVAQSNGCPSLTTTDTVQVHSLPSAKINGLSSTQICADDIITLNSNDADSGSVYSWSPVQYFKGFSNAGPVVSAQITYPGYVTLKITDKWGCKGIDSVYVNAQPCCEVFFPDAFTPNGDGKNDYFRVITKGNHKISTFRIVNRWGQVMFETTDENRGWDGSINGVQQDMGVYYYYIKYRCVDGKYIEQKGELTLIR